MTEQRTAVEKLITDERDGAHQLSLTTRQRARSVEAYLKAGNRPRWMERVVEVDRRIAAERLRIADAYAALRASAPADFAAAWRERAARWVFDPELNRLIGEHNEWYPIERDLPMNPRTGDYVTVSGRSFRRPVLDTAWLLREFPPEGQATSGDGLS